MSVTLTTTWRPQGELPRFIRALPALQALYKAMVIVLPPMVESVEVMDGLATLPVFARMTEQNGIGRHVCLQMAMEVSDSATIHYCDMDRLIRWVECYPDDLKRTVDAIQAHDAGMIARTDVAFGTHPRAMQETELILFDVLEGLIGKRLDAFSGSKAFSREAVAYLLQYDTGAFGIGTDMVWPILLHRAGFEVVDVESGGLDYETADRFLPQAATPEQQRDYAAKVDANPQQWQFRTEIARKIVQSAFVAMTLPIVARDRLADRPAR